MVIAVVVVMIMLLMTAYYGTGLSMKIEEYTTAEVPLAGVGFSVILENDGAFTKTKVVHCEVRTSDGAYEASRGGHPWAGGEDEHHHDGPDHRSRCERHRGEEVLHLPPLKSFPFSLIFPFPGMTVFEHSIRIKPDNDGFDSKD